MGAESPSVAVQLINDNIFQICKNKIKPVFAVIRQKRRIQHLRVRQDEIRAFSDPAPLRRHRIPVIDSRRDPSLSEILKKRLQCPVLIRGKRLCRIDKDRPGERILQNSLEHRKQKAQCLPAGSRS